MLINGVSAIETSCHTKQRTKWKTSTSFSGTGPRHRRVGGRTQKLGDISENPRTSLHPVGRPLPKPDPTPEMVPARARPIVPVPKASARPLPVAQSRRPAARLPAAMLAAGKLQKQRKRKRHRRPLLALPEREAAPRRAEGKPGAEGGGGAGRPPLPSQDLAGLRL